MLTVMCVLKSGGAYDAEWVRKLHDAVKRNIKRPHTFDCLSDVPVPCNRIPLKHDWPAWWSKIELFRPGVINGPALYLDLDTIICGELDVTALLTGDCDFAALRSFWTPDMIGSGVMWFSGENVPHHIYTKFAKQPDAYIAHHKRHAKGTYVGDQAFIWDCLGRKVQTINEMLPGIKSYKFHCHRRLPPDARIVCFHGEPRVNEIDAPWVKEHWA